MYLEINTFIFLTNLLIVCAACVLAIPLGSSCLTALMSLFIVCANLFVGKSIVLFGFHVTATDALAVGTGLTLNILREYFSEDASRKAIITSFYCALVYAVLSQVHLWYAPAATDTCHAHYAAILEIMPRLMIASLCAYGISQYVELYLYGKLKSYWGQKYFVLRNYLSLSASQLIDTIAFSFIGLYGIVDSLSSIILFCYLAKIITVIISAPLINILKKTLLDTNNE